MSCEIQLTAVFEGLSKYFGGEKSPQSESEHEQSRSTIQNFKIAVSPTGEVLVFVKSNWLLICGSKWDSATTDGPKIKYSPNWCGHVTCNPGEEITSVICLPFFSQGQSVHTCADWTCIVLGFSSGCIRFYTEDMQELCCSILQEEYITDIKCYSLSPLQQGKKQKQENVDIYVLYKSAMCIVNGSSLSQTLCSKRNQLAKGLTISDEGDHIPFEFKKYLLVGQEEIIDAVFLDQTFSNYNTFDHLAAVSVSDGFDCYFAQSPPQSSLIVTAGRKPFVGFFYIIEGESNPVLADVAAAVANKIKDTVSATLPNWLSFGNKKTSNSNTKNSNRKKIGCKFGLCDLWRKGQSVIISPDGMFSAVSDSLGRVMLIDNATGIAQRLWKGFRDAQCGFIQVQEDMGKTKRGNHPKPQPRKALFIVIYAPKKGLIEIFCAQHERRVTTFKVSKFGRLLYTPRGQASAAGFSLGQNQVVFVSEEGLKELSIPFHCALVEDSSKIARDLHVLKKIMMLLKMESNSNNSKFVEDVQKYAKELKTDEIRLQAIENMVTYKNITLEALKAVLTVLLEDHSVEEAREHSTSRKITAFAETIHKFLLFYDFLLKINDSPPDTESKKESEELLSEELRMPQKELNIMLKFIKQIEEIQSVKKRTTKVSFDDRKTTLGQYLSHFDWGSFLKTLDKSERPEDEKIKIKLTEKEQKYSYLGKLFFTGIFKSFNSLNDWKRHLESCLLNPIDVCLCLLSYWCNKNTPDGFSYSEMLFLVEVLKVICSLNDPDIVAVEYNAESPWWLRLRTFIAGNPYTIRGLYAALCCRSVSIFVEQERELSMKYAEKKLSSKSSEASESFSNDWETMSKDTCQWDILITQLQDVALLNAVLNLRFKTQSNLPQVPFDFESQCLTAIQSSGTGRVCELVAKWLVQFGFEPSIFINKNDFEFQGAGEEKNEEEKCDLVVELDKANEARNSDDDSKIALDYLALLKNRFPYSLTCSSLLGNMCWEYIAHWFKNITEISYLESAFRYLEVIPANRIKYGISYLSMNTYLQEKFVMFTKLSKLGKVPSGKLCVQVTGLQNYQVSVFLKLINDYLKVMLNAKSDEKPDFGTNREAIWQNSSSSTASCLVAIALSQPIIDSNLLLYQFQLSSALLLMTGLNVAYAKGLFSLFDNAETTSFTLTELLQVNSQRFESSLNIKHPRATFLKKCLTAAVQTLEVIEYVPPISESDPSESVPCTSFKVDEYQKWLRLLFELAGLWDISVDILRRHQICELYSGGFDRLAEEVIPSVNETHILASQLLVLGGKRLKYLIQDSPDFYKSLTKLSGNLSDWLHTMDLENFTYHGSTDDIEVLMRYIAKWLPEDHSDHKLAVAVIESLAFLKNKNT